MSDVENVKEIIAYYRPSLRLIAPLTYYLTIGYVFFNIAIGTSILFLHIPQHLIVAGILSMQTWAVIFIIQGLLLGTFLFKNDWNMTKLFMLIGVCIKTIWLLELLVIGFTYGNFIFVFIWFLLLYLQACIYIYFTPKVEDHHASK